MIPQSAIKQWSEFFPWKNNAQIEQNLVSDFLKAVQ